MKPTKRVALIRMKKKIKRITLPKQVHKISRENFGKYLIIEQIIKCETW